MRLLCSGNTNGYMNIIWLKKYYMVIWISTFMLAASPKCWQIGLIMASQHKEWCHKITSFLVQKIFFNFHFFWNDITKMVRSSKILMSAVIMSILLDIKSKKTWYAESQRQYKIWFREIRYWKWVKICFLLISANNVSLRSGIQTYFLWNINHLSKILWSFSSILPLEAKSYRF